LDYEINTTTERLSSTGGIALAGKILEKIKFESSSIKSKHIDILKSMIGLHVQGRTKYEEISLFREDIFFRDSLNLKYVPARETLRLYLEQMIPEKDKICEALEKFVPKIIKNGVINPVKIKKKPYLPVDIDTSPFNNSKSKKEGVSRTYKNFDGYHPIFCYIGREGYMLNCELREGKQHCKEGTPVFLGKVIKTLPELNIKEPVLFRMDAGNDSKDILTQLVKSKHFFIVKRNLRKELKEYWLSVARSEGQVTYQNRSKTVYTGFHTGRKPAGDESFPAIDVIFKVTESFVAKDGTHLLFPDIEVETYWTNMYESPEDVIELYHDHGTSEQFHSEFKTDMNVERLPSGKFAVNEILMKTAMLSFNILRFIGQTALSLKDSLPFKTKSKRKRLRKVIDDLIRVSVKIVSHSRRSVIRLWDKDPWLKCFRSIYQLCCNL